MLTAWAYISLISPLYLPIHLPHISLISPPYLPCISPQTQRAHAVLTAWAEAMASEANFNAPDDQVLDELLH